MSRLHPLGQRRRSARKVVITATATLMSASLLLPATAQADIPPHPQEYPIPNLYKSCEPGQVTPEWHYGETARRYLNDGSLQFTNSTDQEVDYTAKVETSTNHEIESNSRAKLPSGWSTTAKSDIGLSVSNGWIDGETFGPIKLEPGESFKVEYGVLEKDFVAMFTTCQNGVIRNGQGADVIRGTGPAERYACAYVIKADGTVSDLAIDIPARAQGANSQPRGGSYTNLSGPSLEKLADPQKDLIVEPVAPLQRDEFWPKLGQKCDGSDRRWYPLDITAVNPTFRKPGYSQDFLNWSKGDYTFKPVTDHVVGAVWNGATNFRNDYRLPDGWLESVGAVQRMHMPVNIALKPVELKAGERVRVEYGTTMTRINYREINCGEDKTYSRISNHKQSSAPSGFWAEAVVTSPDGSTRTVDVTPDEWASMPVPTQSTN
ncbi:hypothetical protein CUROG_00355 [Corynebacterium urogenitale]|uniref:Secreted protein n=2 Tax=Corynebacterium urogenitale TaxID=2487892 RepID=A0A5J6Z785_9CORY|nr:hypothetical protein CUROG_00355 [Corynebacterium urogenitale]